MITLFENAIHSMAPNFSESCDVLFECGNDTVKCTVYDTKNHQTVFHGVYSLPSNYLQSFADKADDFFPEKLKRFHVDKVKVAINNTKHILIPGQLFREDTVPNLTDLLLENDDDTLIINKYLSDIDAYSVFGIPTVWQDYFMHWAKPHYTHAQTIFLLGNIALWSSFEHRKATHCVLHKEADTLQVLLVAHGTLQLCNSYTVHTLDDVQHYALNLLYSIEKQSTDIQLHLSGDLPNTLKEVLEPYFQSVDFIQTQGSVSMADWCGEKPETYNQTIFFAQCE